MKRVKIGDYYYRVSGKEAADRTKKKSAYDKEANDADVTDDVADDVTDDVADDVTDDVADDVADKVSK